jgi:pimeloyl-ACP methyl ester carboxylesterase
MTGGQQTVVLPDGRHLAYEDVGNRHGIPVLYCHGMPGCGLERRVFMSDELLKTMGLRVITPDRPGCGGSDFKGNRRIEDWPRDIAVLIEHLRVERFVVLGFSTGTPYALALAASELPVAAVAIVSGDAPPGSVPDVLPGLPATARIHSHHGAMGSRIYSQPRHQDAFAGRPRCRCQPAHAAGVSGYAAQNSAPRSTWLAG